MAATLFGWVQRRPIKMHARKLTPELKMILLLLLEVVMMSSGTHGHTVCTAVSTVQDTTVTCYFGADISQQGFSVQVFPTPKSDGVQILACNRQSSGGLICDQRKDVHFDKSQKVIDQLTLTRPPSNHTKGVQYLCEPVPSVQGHVQRCDLTHKDIPSVTTTNTKIGKDPFIVAILVLFILVIIAVTVISVTCYIKHRRSKRSWAKSINDRWPGAAGEPEAIPMKYGSRIEESSYTSAVSKREIPQGLAWHFYILGLEDAKEDGQKESGAPRREEPGESGTYRKQATEAPLKTEHKTKGKYDGICDLM